MKGLGKFLCVIGEIAAVLLVIGLLLQYIDNIYHFMPIINNNTTLLDLIVKYGITLVIGIIALGASMKAHPILMILVALVIAAVVGFMFYGDAINVFLPNAGGAEEDAAMLVAMIA